MAPGTHVRCCLPVATGDSHCALIGLSSGHLVAAALPPGSAEPECALATVQAAMHQQLLPAALSSISTEPAAGPCASLEACHRVWCLHEDGEAAAIDPKHLSAVIQRCNASASSPRPRVGVAFRRWAFADPLRGEKASPWCNLRAVGATMPRGSPAERIGALVSTATAAGAAGRARQGLLVSGGGSFVLSEYEADEDKAVTSLRDTVEEALSGARAAALQTARNVPLVGSMLGWVLSAAPEAGEGGGDGADIAEAAAAGLVTPAEVAACRKRSALRVLPLRRAADPSRLALPGQMLQSPCGRYAAVADSIGRVSVVQLADMAVCRLWKGYRSAQVGWARNRAEELLLIIWAPRRRVLEAWPALIGERCVAIKLPEDGAVGLVPWVRHTDRSACLAIGSVAETPVAGDCGCWLVQARPIDGEATASASATGLVEWTLASVSWNTH